MAANLEPLDLEDAPELLTTNELRRVLRCGRRQAYALMEEESLGLKVRGAWRVPRERLRRYIYGETNCDATDGKEGAGSG